MHLGVLLPVGSAAGMLGTAAITITSPTASAAAAQQASAAANPSQQQATETSISSISSQSLSDAEACSGSGSGSSCCQARGAAAARDPAINSGCATPAAVRQQQQISGLVPPRQVRLLCVGNPNLL
jgi:hypothetical protein